MSTEYDDDRPGMMRVHIAQRRAALATVNYTRVGLVNFAKRRELTISYSLTKKDIAYALAQRGYLDAEGALRMGWPV